MSAELAYFVIVGFAAQLVDGTIGMAYGVVSTTALLAAGVSPLRATANIHFAELVTTAATGIFHLRWKNVSWAVVRTLVAAGAIGAVLGALWLVVLTPRDVGRVRTIVSIYLLVLGFWILSRAYRTARADAYRSSRAAGFGFLGGLCDAMGGGWGPIVTSNLVVSGLDPRVAVGSSIVAEFAITAIHSAIFFGVGDIRPDRVMLGLLIGGLLAAPIAPRIAATLPRKTMILIVGVVVIVSSVVILAR